MTPVIVESATTGDIDSMYHVSLLAHQAGYEELIPANERHAFDERYRLSEQSKHRYETATLPYIEQPDHRALVAKLDGHVVGYVTMRRQDDELQLKSLFVHPEYQGMGIGSVLFKQAIASADGSDMTLTVIEANDRAKHLYEKYGFRVIGASPALFFGARQVIMKRSGQDGSS